MRLSMKKRNKKTRALGRHTTRGASFLVSSVCGGAVFPPIMGFAGFAVGWSFPFYLSLVKAKELAGYLESKATLATTLPMWTTFRRKPRFKTPSLDLSVEFGLIFAFTGWIQLRSVFYRGGFP